VPDVPTMAEVLNKPGFETIVWYALLGPLGMKPEHVRKLNAEVRKAMVTATMKELLDKATVELSLSTPEELGALSRSDADLYRKLLNDLGAKPQ
jgi:tripartite-type tricarboxylate transporter receptor subunit TctC